jgi:PIN domain nuclease of toxin-antitoxin system
MRGNSEAAPGYARGHLVVRRRSAVAGRSARQAIGDDGNEVIVSAVSGWEIATKYRIGKLPELEPIVGKIGEYAQAALFKVLDVTMEHAELAGSLPGPHRDPFDRLLIAQTRVEWAAIVSLDPIFPKYSVPVVWNNSRSLQEE